MTSPGRVAMRIGDSMVVIYRPGGKTSANLTSQPMFPFFSRGAA